MGRSPFFTLNDIPLMKPTDASDALKKLQPGQTIKFRLSTPKYSHENPFPMLPRSVSTYDYIPSRVSQNITYIVEHVDYITSLSEIGLRVIALIDSKHHSPSEHMYAWYVTTDGYIRECEHFGLLYSIESIEVIS